MLVFLVVLCSHFLFRLFPFLSLFLTSPSLSLSLPLSFVSLSACVCVFVFLCCVLCETEEMLSVYDLLGHQKEDSYLWNAGCNTFRWEGALHAILCWKQCCSCRIKLNSILLPLWVESMLHSPDMVKKRLHEYSGITKEEEIIPSSLPLQFHSSPFPPFYTFTPNSMGYSTLSIYFLTLPLPPP